MVIIEKGKFCITKWKWKVVAEEEEEGEETLGEKLGDRTSSGRFTIFTTIFNVFEAVAI